MKPHIGLAAAAILLLAAPAARAQDEGAIPGMEQIILQLTMQGLLDQLFNPPDNMLDPHNANTWIGFAGQNNCSMQIGYISTVPGRVPGGEGFPCVPDLQYPPLGAGMQRLTNLTPAQCSAIASAGIAVVQHTVVANYQSINPKSGIAFGSPDGVAAGGFCSGNSELKNSFAGWLLDSFTIIAVDVLSDVQCAYLVNMCTGPCSCGPYHAE
jgi:hypothetical protein